MVKRMVAVPLWFISVWMTYGLVAYFTGWPTNAGAIIGALAAALVFLDPTGVFWGAPGRTGDRVEAKAVVAPHHGLDGSRSTL